MNGAAKLAAPAAFVLVATALFAPYVVSGERFLCVDPAAFPPWGPQSAESVGRTADFAATDQVAFMRPNYVHWRRSLTSDLGGLFWNPDALCGTPFLATQDTYAFYPLNALVFVFGDVGVFAAGAALHGFFAALGAYLLFRRFSCGRYGAAFGAIAFGFGPWMIARFDYPNLFQTAAWAPWIAYSAHRAAVDRRTRDRALLAFAFAMSVYAGMIQLTIVSLFFGGVVALFGAAPLLRARGAAAAAGGLFSALLGVAYGAALAAPQWLPLFDYAKSGARMAADVEALRASCLKPAEWWTLLRPDLFGSPPELLRRAIEHPGIASPVESAEPLAARFGLRSLGATFSEVCMAPFAAAAVLMLSGVARRPGIALLGFGLALFGGAAASNTFVFDLVHGAPGAAFGNPKRWLLLTAFGGAALAAAGADGDASPLGRRLVAGFVATLALFGATLRFGADLFSDALARATGASADAATLSLEASGEGLLWSFGFAALAAIGVFRPGRLGRATAVLALVVEAVLFQLAHNPGIVEGPTTPPTETSAFLRRGAPEGESTPHRLARVFGDPELCARLLGTLPTPHLFAANTTTQFQIRDAHGYEGVLNPRIEYVFEALAPGSVLAHHRVETFADPSIAASPLLDFLGVRWILSQRETPPPGTTLAASFPTERLAIFENVDALPTETRPPTARLFDDDATLRAALVAPDFNPRREVLLLREDAARVGIRVSDADAEGRVVLHDAGAEATPKVLRRRSANAAFELRDAGAPSLLVSAETDDPGWRYFDSEGRELPKLRANDAFQAALVPRDATFVERRYRPSTFPVALVAALVGAAALGADSRVRRRKGAERPRDDAS